MASEPKDEEKSKTSSRISRRQFVAGTVGGVVVGAVIGAAAGSIGFPKTVTSTEVSTQTSTETSTQTTTLTTTSTYSFETPITIAPSQITNTVNADVIVLGAGPSGCAAAVSAAGSGASVILLEKYSTATAPGEFFGAINTQDQIAAGKTTDVATLVQALQLFSESRAQYPLLMTWAVNSGPVMDWLLGIAKQTNTPYFTIAETTYGEDYLFGQESMLADIGASEFPLVYQMLIDYGQTMNMQVQYNTRALQLIRPNNQGGVTGVIAQNSDGSYTQYNAGRAVVICTGDIANNLEMVAKYIPWTNYSLDSAYNISTNTGDGLAMALWAGANIPDEPGCGMVHFFSTNAKPILFGRPVGAAGLYVNQFGDRFINEGLINGMPEYTAPLVMRQPGQTMWQIFDSKSVTSAIQSTVQTMLATGEVTTGNTIEELAATFGADPTRLTAAVNRYNELVALGVDLDFGKPAVDLAPANDTPPYYACESPPDYLVGIHGPLTDTNMQVLDTNNQPIPGLYAAGNCTSGFFGDGYPFSTFAGLAKGHALTTGRIAGLNAATGNTSTEVVQYNATQQTTSQSSSESS